jgi:hypothetical protein
MIQITYNRHPQWFIHIKIYHDSQQDILNIIDILCDSDLEMRARYTMMCKQRWNRRVKSLPSVAASTAASSSVNRGRATSRQWATDEEGDARGGAGDRQAGSRNGGRPASRQQQWQRESKLCGRRADDGGSGFRVDAEPYQGARVKRASGEQGRDGWITFWFYFIFLSSWQGWDS